LIPKFAIGIAYRIVVEWILSVELPWRTKVGARPRLYHGVGLVINDGTIIGDDVVLRHGVTIGHIRPGGGSPKVGDGVEFAANSMALGEIDIGAHSKIGPMAVVMVSIPPFSVALAPTTEIHPRRREGIRPAGEGRDA
jgi:serine acetyltransferase